MRCHCCLSTGCSDRPASHTLRRQRPRCLVSAQHSYSKLHTSCIVIVFSFLFQVVLTNVPESHFEEVEAKVFPGRSDATYKVPFTRVVYIEETDFKEKDEKDYYGLAPEKSVMLRWVQGVWEGVGHGAGRGQWQESWGEPGDGTARKRTGRTVMVGRLRRVSCSGVDSVCGRCEQGEWVGEWQGGRLAPYPSPPFPPSRPTPFPCFFTHTMQRLFHHLGDWLLQALPPSYHLSLPRQPPPCRYSYATKCSG